MNRIVRVFLTSAFLLTVNSHAAVETTIASSYTDLSDRGCKLLKMDRETGSSTQKCPGVGGFRLLVLDDDARMSINVLAPNDKEYPLDYWNVITHSFSGLGKKAEWRVVKRQGVIQPIALIVRVYTSERESPGALGKKSYLAVAKISTREICVTDKIAAGRDANAKARQAADNATDKPCLKR